MMSTKEERLSLLLKKGMYHTISSNYLPHDLNDIITDDEWQAFRDEVFLNFNSVDPEKLMSYDDDSTFLDDESTVLAREFLKFFMKKGYSLSDIKGWSKTIEHLASYVIEDKQSPDGEQKAFDVSGYSYYQRNDINAYLMAVTFIKDYDWGILFDKIQQNTYYHYWGENHSLIVDQYAEKFSADYRSFLKDKVHIKDPIERLGHYHRGKHYYHYIKAGLLTHKEARKIRSESSEAASLSGVRALFDFKDKYSDFEDLIGQFVDTRYSDVSLELAKKLPVGMLSYLVSCDHWHTKSCVEKRLEAFLKEKENG